MSKEAPTAEGAPTAAPKAASPWPAVLAVVILTPALSFATIQYLVLPKLTAAAAEQGVKATAGKGEDHGPKVETGGHGAGAKPAGGHGSKGGGHGAAEKSSAEGKFAATYDFDSIVVNLAGSMGTRYLKATFTLCSNDASLPEMFSGNKKQLLDVALSVLGSKTLADLETPGAKNLVRNDLVANFNQALNTDAIEQLYFTEFVIQ